MAQGARLTRQIKTSAHNLLVGIILTFLMGCLPATGLEFVVPDGYEGFLLVRYDCPGGQPVVRRDSRTIITFRSNGTACVSDSHQDVFSSSAFRIERIQSASGNRTIPWVVDATNAQGVGLVSISTAQSGQADRVLATFSEFWIGDMAHLRGIVANGQYSEKLAQVYEALGKQRDGTIGPPKPVAAP